MDDRNCLVCSVPIVVTHLGVDACRACAAFFKRTEIAGRKFVCRQSNGKCVIRKHDKFMCRSCRYDKCVEFGMAYVLPPKRKPRKEREVIVDAETPSTSSSSATTTPAPAIVSLIDRMGAEYKISVDRRLSLEKEYVARHNLQPFPHPNEELFTNNFDSFYELFRIKVHSSTALLKNVIDDFGSFPIAHRVTLFKNFICKFAMMELVYLTDKYFDNNTSFMTSLITCAELQNVDQWMTDKDNIANKDAFRTSVKGFMDDYVDLLGPMSKIKCITEREFHALAVLIYCDVDTSLNLPEEIIENARKTRAQIFEELQEYYKHGLKLRDFSQRLGHLMTLAHVAGEASILMGEEMRMYATMFDVYSDDQLFREFLTN